MMLSPAVMSRIAGPLSSGAAMLAVAAACAAVAASLVLAPDSRGLWGAGLAVLMIAIAAVDAGSFIIPDPLTVAALVVGLAHAAADAPPGDMLAGVGWAVVRGAAPALVFLAVKFLYRWWRGRDGIGLGDVKLAAVGGVWLDWTAIPVAIDIAAVAALGAYLVFYLFPRLRTRGGHARPIRTLRLPFGLFLAPAIWLAFIADAALMFDPFRPPMFSFH